MGLDGDAEGGRQTRHLQARLEVFAVRQPAELRCAGWLRFGVWFGFEAARLPEASRYLGATWHGRIPPCVAPV